MNPQMSIPPNMIGGQPGMNPVHPSLDIFSRFIKGEVTRDQAVDAFSDYIMTGIRGIPVPTHELAKSVLSSESSNFMQYPQIIQCMALLIKTP
jgi:hypothetical protein